MTAIFGFTASRNRRWQLLNSQMSFPLLQIPHFRDKLFTKELIRQVFMSGDQWPASYLLQVSREPAWTDAGNTNLAYQGSRPMFSSLMCPDSLRTKIIDVFTYRENHPSNIMEMHHYEDGGVMIWVGMMLDDHTDLHVFQWDTLTALRYRTEPKP